MIGVYLLGVFTLPVLAAVGFVLFFSFSRSNVLAHESTCQFCEAAGWPLHLPKGEHRLNLTQWFWDVWHRFVTGRRKLHRELWSLHFDAHPRLIRRWPNAWKHYGLHDPQSHASES